jgi:hypothetical protein
LKSRPNSSADIALGQDVVHLSPPHQERFVL